MSILQDIQMLQFHDKAGAEALLLRFVRESFSFDAVTVELRPLAVSLNSFNGLMTLADGRRLFFKTHTEADSVIGEYYNADKLAKAGYPVIQPIFSSTENEKQFLVYEVIDDPSVFDLAWAIENGNSDLLSQLTAAQNAADDQLLQLYQNTLADQPAEEAASAPIHQLFYHRLTGGRLARFYADDVVMALPKANIPMPDVLKARWTINGQKYDATLRDLIHDAIRLLDPKQASISIVGHGDAHNGNVFFRQAKQKYSLVYFDPAFAGRHHPLLDLTKPLFHNVFAMWMYFPRDKQAQTSIVFSRDGDHWQVEHNYVLHPVRKMFLQSKVDRVLHPILHELRTHGLLRADWRQFLKSALFCCPLLTMNLADPQKFPPEISLLGLSMAIEMGAESSGQRSLIDQLLDSL
jgi:hypothetical protein